MKKIFCCLMIVWLLGAGFSASPQPVLTPVAGQEWRDSVTGMEFVWIPGGCFQMGQTENEKRELIKDVGEEKYKKYYTDELPRHKVCLDGFWMGKYEVTQAEWQTVMGNNPSSFKGDARPVETVSWDDVQQFIQKLNSRSDGTFRLPSEAEWEHACRAGSQTAYSFGNDSNRLGEYAWYTTNSRGTTHPVGQLKPNAFGLYDMHGNVWEWCEDPWHKNYQGAPTDGSVWLENGEDNLRLLKGGSWLIDPGLLRCAYRLNYWHDDRGINRGVRLVGLLAGSSPDF